MSILRIKPDFFTEVRLGNVPGYLLTNQFGYNSGLPNGTWEHINELGLTAFPLSAASTVRIKAGGSANDTAAGGSGAREVKVLGLDSSGNHVENTLTPDGANASASSSSSFWRIHRAWVSSCGTYGGANAADIVIENSAGSADIIRITAGVGESLAAEITVPSGKQGSLLSAHMATDSVATVSVRLMVRENLTDTIVPVSAKRIKLLWTGIEGGFNYRPDGPKLLVPALSDIWFEGSGGPGGGAVSISLQILFTPE